MTKLLMRTFSSDENWNADFDFALADIDADHAGAIADKMALVRTLRATNPDLVEMTFDDAVCAFYKGGAFWDEDCELNFDEKARQRFEEFGWCFLPDDLSVSEGRLEDHETRADGVYLIVSSTHFRWHGLPRHASITIDSESLDATFLAQVTQGSPAGTTG